MGCRARSRSGTESPSTGPARSRLPRDRVRRRALPYMFTTCFLFTTSKRTLLLVSPQGQEKKGLIFYPLWGPPGGRKEAWSGRERLPFLPATARYALLAVLFGMALI